MLGRPSSYSEEILNSALEYLENLPQDEVVHSIEGLADYLNLHRSTIYAWKEQYPGFSDIVEAVLRKQAKKLASKGLSNEFNSSITKLMLTKHGYSDKQEVDTNLKADINANITGMKIINDGDRVQNQESEATPSS